MKVVTTFHHPTSVIQSLKCNLSEDLDSEYLVVAKTNKLEVFALTPDGLTLQCTQDIWGRIISLQIIPKRRSQLLVITDHPDPKTFLIDYIESSEFSAPRFMFSTTLSLYERGARPAEFFTGAVTDPRGDVVIISSYVGKLKVLELSNGRVQSDFDISVRELNILSLCFLHSPAHSSQVLAILHRDHTQKIILTSHDLSVTEFELSSFVSPLLPETPIRDPYSCLLIPVPPHAKSSWNDHGGVLVLGGTKVLFYPCTPVDKKQKRRNNHAGIPDKANERRKRTATAQVEWPYSDISAWVQVDIEGTRYLLGDGFGRLALLAVNLLSAKLELLFLGDMSPPTSLTPLSSEYIFVGSHFGDSQVLRIHPDKSSSSGTYLEVVDEFKNIAPIMDAVVADTDGSGQPQVVTCSGGRSSGSLRVIRNGANFREEAVLDGFPNVAGIFPLKSSFCDEFDTYLLISTPISTHIYEFSSSSALNPGSLMRISEDIFMGITHNSRTITASNVMKRSRSSGELTYENSPHIVQVTPQAVFLVNLDLRVVEDQWIPATGQEIIVADISPSQICVGLTGGRVVLLIIDEDQIKQSSDRLLTTSAHHPAEISALAFAPSDPTKPFSHYLAIGFWEPYEVKVFKLPGFELKGEPVTLSYLPRSVLLRHFEDSSSDPQTHLLIGQGDGTVAVFSFRKGILGNKRTIPLGDTPVLLTACSVDGRPTVFASGDRCAIIFWNKEALQHSPVSLKAVLATSFLNALAFPSSLVLASATGLSIGCIEELDKLHIRTVPMGLENPVRIAYHEEAKLFGVGCVRAEPHRLHEIEQVSSSFKIMDESFSLLHTYPLEREEELTALGTVALECEGQTSTFFGLGSLFYEISEKEPTRGRILIFVARNPQTLTSVDQRSSSYLHASADTKGCVFAITSVKGKLIAAVNTSVVLYGMENPSPATSAPKLIRLTEWNHNYLVTSLVSRNDILITGDAISSVAVLRLVGASIKTAARDYGPLWPLCLETFDETSIIGANSDSNLFSFKLQTVGDKMILERDGSYHIDDNVNKFVSGHLTTDANQVSITAKQLFFTSSGRIGVVIDMDEAFSLHMSALQRNMADVLGGPGDVDHTAWRAPVSARGRSDAQVTSYGFLDGDFIEQYLKYSPTSSEANRILSGKSDPEKIAMSHNQIRSVLETLQSMH